MKRFLFAMAAAFTIATVRAATGDENWQAGFVLPPGLDGEVYAAASIGSNLYVGGRFEKAGDTIVNSIALWDGTNWHALDVGVSGIVYALAVQGTDLFVGGQFTRAGAVPAVNLAKWNGSTWSSVGDVQGTDANSSTAPGFGVPGAKVITLFGTTNRLVVGGNFRSAGAAAATNIAAWDGTNWTAFGAGIGSLGGEVRALAEFRGQLFAGGVFNNCGDLAVTNVARWSGTNWHACGAGLIGPSLDYWQSSSQFRGAVNALAIMNKKLVAGGQVTTSGKTKLVNLAIWTGKKWKTVKNGVGTPDIASSVDGISVRGRDAFVTGLFAQAGATKAANIVRWDGKRWSTLGTGLGGPARPVAFVGTNVYAGGFFGLAGGVSAAYIACWNSASNSWSALGQGVGNTLIEQARTLAVMGDTVYCAGPIHTAGTNLAHNVAAWTGTNWLVIEPGLSGMARASAVVRSNYYVSGQFYIESVRATNLACLTGTNWSALPPLLDANTNPAVVFAMIASSNLLYVAGNFVSAGGVAATNIAAWNGSNWMAVGDAPAVTPLVTSLPMAANAQHLYVLNTITNNTATQEQIYRWDGTNWLLIGAPNGAGHIRSLSLYGSYLHVASSFDQAGDTDTTKLDRWNVDKWEAVNWPFGKLGHVPLLAATERYLYAGGPWDYTASSSPGIARFDGANWSPCGSGLIDTDGFGAVETIAVSSNRVIVAGFFKIAGGKPSYRFAIWNEP